MSSSSFWVTWGKRLLILPPIVLAIIAYGWMVKHTPPLAKHSEKESSRPLETIVVPRVSVRPQVNGFGTAKYARSWRAITQVQGRIKKIHPDLRPGSRIRKGDVLFEIDDSDYRSRVKELDAAIEQQQAEVEQLEQSVKNDEAKLTLEKDVMGILKREFQRQEKLVAQRAEAKATIDIKQREYLAQVESVQNLNNGIAMVVPQVKAMKAAIRQSEVQKEQAQRDIGRTTIEAPFNMRVGNVQLEVDQFVSTGEELFVGYSGTDVEVEVQLPMQAIHRLLVSQVGDIEDRKKLTPETFKDMFQFKALVHVVGTETYEGKFLRVREVVDAQTKMVGFVVGVKNKLPSQQERPQPPLLEGAFCDVDIFGAILPDQVVIPRRALRNGSVYLMDDENRLASREVEVKFTQKDYAVIESGLTGGEKLVIANPSPAIIGMLIDPVVAEEETKKLIASATASDDLLGAKTGTLNAAADSQLTQPESD